ncbi:MAG: hypothetical protein RTU63_07780 [Candidatus Thorarchaeota archaeon]
MTITLTYTKTNGNQKRIDFEDDTEVIDLGRREIESVNLTPLGQLKTLMRLHMSRNHLQSIDLTPLSSCRRLTHLDLANNQLQSIDLTPLATLPILMEISLHGNDFRELDLSPYYKSLVIPAILGAQLIFHKHKKPYSIERISSWLRPEGQNWEIMRNSLLDPIKPLIYSRPATSQPWKFLREVIMQFAHDYRIQQDILASLNLIEYGFIDCDLTGNLLTFAHSNSSEEVLQSLISMLLIEITKAIDEGRTTTGLKLEEIITRHIEIAKRTKRITKLREREIQEVRVGVKADRVDLRELWCTAFGYEILSAFDMKLTTDKEGLARIKIVLGELGFRVKTGRTSVSGVKMSDKLKKAIWWIVENRGRPWSEIKE